MELKDGKVARETHADRTLVAQSAADELDAASQFDGGLVVNRTSERAARLLKDDRVRLPVAGVPRPVHLLELTTERSALAIRRELWWPCPPTARMRQSDSPATASAPSPSGLTPRSALTDPSLIRKRHRRQVASDGGHPMFWRLLYREAAAQSAGGI
jgi:hypothetical protein